MPFQVSLKKENFESYAKNDNESFHLRPPSLLFPHHEWKKTIQSKSRIYSTEYYPWSTRKYLQLCSSVYFIIMISYKHTLLKMAQQELEPHKPGIFDISDNKLEYSGASNTYCDA
jgi:hypothetical protein